MNGIDRYRINELFFDGQYKSLTVMCKECECFKKSNALTQKLALND